MADELHPGSLFAGLVVERLVASGGMGSIYRATDPTLRRTVALKVVAPALADDSSYRERFLLEARLAAKMEHPAIVPVYGAGESKGRLYLAMRFMEDGSLKDLLDRSGPLAMGEMVRLLRPVADALDAAHRTGLVHRDVKPGNVLLQGDRAYLADFGLAVTAAPGESLLSAADAGLSGTMGYLAPEQIEGERASAASDQYALACIVVECLTGQKPFARENDLAVIYAHLQEPPPSVVALRPDLPPAADSVVARGLAKRPSDRFGSCRELVDSLESAAGLVTTASPARRTRRGWIVAGLVGCTAAATVAILINSSGRTPPSAGDGVAVIDPVHGKQVGRIPVGSGPLAIAAGGGSIWVVNADDHTISRVDANSHAPVGTSFALGDASPVGLAYGDNALWVATGSGSDKIDFGTITNAVVRVDPTNDQASDPIRLRPNRTSDEFHRSGTQITVGGGSVWVIDPSGSVERIDPATRTARVVPDDGYEASAIAYGEGAAWVLGEHVDESGDRDGPYVWRIDRTTFRPSKPIRVQTKGASDLTVGAGSVWVASPWDGLVVRIPPGPQPSVRTITAPGATGVSFDESAGVLWVVDPVGGTVRKIDPQTNNVGNTVQISGAPQAVAAAAGSVFATVISADTQAAVSRAAGPGDVKLPGCQAVWSDPATPPDLLIVGDYPFNEPSSRVDSQAVLSVLREHHFRAGVRTVGYQACDDQGGYNTTTPSCSDHGQAYAQTPRVVAVITGFLSACAQEQLPLLLGAAPGPVAAIGPVNTEDALTSGAYRNYVRVTPTEGEQTAAGVGLFVDQKAARVFVLSEDAGISYVDRVSTLFRRLSTGRVTLAGEANYSEDGSDAQQIAGRVGLSDATGVYLIGFPDKASGELLTALRALGRDFVIIAPDLFTPVSDDIAFAGDSARGVYVTSTNPPNGFLPPVGRRWLHRFAATQLGAQVPTSSALAAGATEALLDAIARSDGTRGSVVAALRETNLPDSIIGPLQFTASGDIKACRISIYQIVGGTFFVPDVQQDLQGAQFVGHVGCHTTGKH